MKSTPISSQLLLRQLFDDLVEIPPTERAARTAQLNLPADIAFRLQAMVAFNEIVEAPPELRESRLVSMMLPDDVAERVREMLTTDSKAPLLKAAATESLNQVPDPDSLARALIGTAVGTFRLTALLGQGGSSVVFRAEREAGNGKQSVALKLLRTGLYSEDAHRRFRREQSILAQLTHPNIATLIEAGISPAGIPYLAMELVDGLPITDSANKRCLTLEQRLAQFATLCRTIEAAHAMLIVHRDLKPSNLLVTRDGNLKVLDFGIAGLIETEEHVTRTQSIVLTPEYAAPEQHSSSAIRTALDVYSLGVVLGELLTGCRLNSHKRASSAASSREAVTRLPKGAPPARILARRLKGDLDCVLACALADDPAARYSSAGAFADDIERYLAGKPVRAHPPTRSYRARKFVARHALTVGITAVLLCAVLAALGVALWQATVAKNQALMAAEQARRAETVRDLLVSVFDEAGADVPKEKRPTVQEIVEKETVRLLQQDTSSEAVRADLLPTMAKVADGIGSYDEALALLDKAIPTIERIYGSSSAIFFSATVLRAQALIHKSRYSEATSLLAPLRNEFIQQRTPTAIDGLILLSKAMVHNHQADDGLALARETVLLAQSKGIAEVNQVLQAMINEASNLIDMQRFQEGFRSADAALSLWHQTGEAPSRQIITLYENMAVAAEANGDISRAEVSYKQAIALGNLFFDQPSPVIAWDIGLYGTFLVAQGRLDDAEPYLRDALAMRRKTFGEFDPHTLYAVAGMGKLDFAKGDYQKATEWYSQGIEVCRAHSVQSVICPRLFALRGRAYSQYGQFENADQDLQKAMQLQRKLSGEESLSYAYVLENLIVVQLSQQQYKDALATADSILELRKKLNGGMLQTALSTRFYRAEALLALDRADDALTELLDVEGEYARLLPHGELQFGILAAQAKAFARLHRVQAAQEVAKRALSIEQKGKNPDPRTITDLKRIASSAT